MLRSLVGSEMCIRDRSGIGCSIQSNIFFSHRKTPEDSDHYIPHDFAHLVRITLSKLSGTGSLAIDLIDQNFWKAWPRKFTSAASYAKRKDSVGVHFVTLTQLTIINYLINSLLGELTEAKANPKTTR